eukprot:gnl/Hemi2/9209_TR3204_c0_g1_i1.p1 gnl/Hemi2/9209_TR3204_c0_g1~~gnl/Hemi2/9209_TR3204_c0_g1_i1.p1  ORF type:complete len:453 (-),score=115.34 gnl/Hemi2/9209_TR3204_c0_g1_i1:774-2132(-)
MQAQVLAAVLLLACAVSAARVALPQRRCTPGKESESLLNPLRCGDVDRVPGQAGLDFLAANKGANLTLQPVILMPGLGGSALENKLVNDDVPFWYCSRNSDWERVWLALENIVVQDCWIHNLNLTYTTATNNYSSPAGVSIRVVDWGGTSGIDYLDKLFGISVGITTYYADMIKSLVAAGYVIGENLRGAPYDWRLPADVRDGQGLFLQIQTLIEQTYAANNNTPVHIVSHSMGGMETWYFLSKQTQDWKDQYIKSWIPIAAPWDGAPKALRAMVSGDNFGMQVGNMSLIDLMKFRTIIRNAGGVTWMIPTVEHWNDSVFVTTPQRNYTASDFAQLFTDMGSAISIGMWDHTKNLTGNLHIPNVTLHCIIGVDLPTETSYDYPTGFDAQPTITYAKSGDGTVPLESSQRCSDWAAQQPKSVDITPFSGVAHTALLADSGVISFVLGLVTAPG